MNKLFDLRFVIGSFFLIVGLLLLIYSFISSESAQSTQEVNRWCGIIFIIFGGLMIFLSMKKNADDELLEENK